MIILSVEGLRKAFGANEVLRDIYLTLQQGQRMGLVGVNGSGKSTLFKLLVGLETPDAGHIHIARGLKVGYLPQQNAVEGDLSVWEEMSLVFAPVREMEERLRELEQRMADLHRDPQALDQISREYARLTDAFEDVGGYAWRGSIQGVLTGLGFPPDQWERPAARLSGGERTRLCLARLLLQKPDLLLLDEPTNHLDLEAMQWLETTLAAYRGTVLVISHDRYFLDAVCDCMAELLLGRIEQYSGSYTRYMDQRDERFESRIKAYNLQQREIERQQAIITRFRMFNREKSIRAAESREKTLARMEKLEKPLDERAIRFAFQARRRTGEDVLRIRDLSKAFERRTLFAGLSLHVRAGDRVAVIGPNGVGKSTLFRILTQQILPDSGTVRLGSNVDMGYYDQHQATLHPDKTVLDEVWDRFPRLDQTDVRNALGLFLFTGEDVFQPIRTLSGGEKGRVALTELMLKRDNLLLLDEPTNHLDMDSCEVLEAALEGFTGTILTISHDRYFINRVANRVLEMRPDGIAVYEGNYDSYAQQKRREAEPADEAPQRTRTAQGKERKRERLNQEQARAQRAHVTQLEQAIQALEATIAGLEAQMADPALYVNPAAATDTTQCYRQATADLQALYENWAEASETLDEQLS
ncbi:MAG: ABC-F family ATP-binding cassette domain-containing protein [Oscillospiraceae bacterium]|jgi:ATP-binding cassette subfamily F protein 3|nr:ABC-F family ATP-binding cassette domain-containing protein [Oscillospiraceae bacterium]